MQVKKILVIILCIFGSFVSASATNYIIDSSHTSVTWNISHFGFSKPSGKWMVESGVITLDENNLNNSKVTATIQVEDINSGIQKLDQELIGKQFFDAPRFPTAVFVSTNVKQKSANKLIVTGNLTLHGITKPVTLNVTLNKLGMRPVVMQKGAGFSAAAVIKRSDFGIKAYLPGLGDIVNLLIEVEAAIPAKDPN
ncbi:MAG: yceI 1 [Burkholderiales bacterium]|nr:yceI 1 [Burkholderiales bacterium]